MTFALLALDAPLFSLVACLELGFFARLALLLLLFGALLGRQFVVAALLLLTLAPQLFGLFARLAFLLRSFGPPLGVPFPIPTLELLGRKHGRLAQLGQRSANGIVQRDLVLDVRRRLAHLTNGLAQPRGDLG